MAEFETWSAGQLAAVPVKDGFRLRGTNMNRLETFTDAAFAFAVTLLVVGGGDAIPADFDQMAFAMKQVPAFAASFANIMLFWYAHHVWSRRFGLADAGSVALSLLLIFVVLIYVYPLKAIYSGALDFFSRGYLESYFGITSMEDLRSMFVIFGAGYIALSGVIVLLNRHALARHEQLMLDELEIFDTQTDKQHWIINMAVPAISVVLSLTLPDTLVVTAGIFYSIFGVLIPMHAAWRGKRRDRLLAGLDRH